MAELCAREILRLAWREQPTFAAIHEWLWVWTRKGDDLSQWNNFKLEHNDKPGNKNTTTRRRVEGATSLVFNKKKAEAASGSSSIKMWLKDEKKEG